MSKRKPRKPLTARERCDAARLRSSLLHVRASVGDPPCRFCRQEVARERANNGASR